MIDVPATGAAGEREVELASGLERDLVPLPPAAASAIVEPPSAPRLELSEVGPQSSRNPASARSADVAPPAHIGSTKASPSSLDLAPPIVVVPEAAESLQARIAQAESAQAGVAAEAVSTVPTPSTRSAAVSSRPEPVAERRRPRAARAALWIATAVVPAATVWLLMRPARHQPVAVASRTTLEYRAQTAQNPAVHEPLAPAPEAPAPAAQAPETLSAPTNEATAQAQPSASATTEAAQPAAGEPVASTTPSTVSAVPSADPSTEVVVETDSKDRVSVLVKTRPDGARVLRRGKEIGRTPLTIQIGRGEHRIFEVSMVGFGAKRITLDGEKPEIMVNMATEAKPTTVVVPAKAQGPALMPANKYDRLE